MLLTIDNADARIGERREKLISFTTKNWRLHRVQFSKISISFFPIDEKLTKLHSLEEKYEDSKVLRECSYFLCLSSPSCSYALTDCCRHCVAKTAAILWSISFRSLHASHVWILFGYLAFDNCYSHLFIPPFSFLLFTICSLCGRMLDDNELVRTM